MSWALVTSVVAFIVAIGVLVAVHEYGHFWVARRLGFKVLRFSIGFGRPLWMRLGRAPDRVEYVVAAVPLGGYVRLLDEREGPVAPQDLDRAFNRRPPLARIAVLLAGPGANFLFAVAAFWLLFLLGVAGLKPVVGEVRADSPAAIAGLRHEDEVLRVSDEATPTRETAVLAILGEIVDGGRVPLTVRGASGGERRLELFVPEGERHALTEPGALLGGLGFSFWSPPQPVLVAGLEAGGPAELAGLAAGDEVIAIDGEPVREFRQFVLAVRSRPGETLTLTVRRGDGQLALPVVVRSDLEDGGVVGRVGLTVSNAREFPAWMQTEERHGPLGALAPALRETWSKTSLTLRFLWRMVTGNVSTKNISGPINIAQYAGLTATAGFDYYLAFLALVSISLAVLNLLPVPVLDGGQIVFQLAEMAKGSPLSMATQVAGQKLGIAMLVALMGFAFYNDITRLLG